MTATVEFLSVQCPDDGDELIRITDGPTDTVICPICHASGEYEDVIKQGGGLVRGILIEEKSKDLIDRLRRRREAGF